MFRTQPESWLELCARKPRAELDRSLKQLDQGESWTAGSGALVPPASQAGTPGAPSPSPAARVLFCFAAGEAFREKFKRARGLLRTKHPRGEPEHVFGEALEVFLERKDPERRARKNQALKRPPRAGPERRSRRIPQWVKDEVWRRDGGRCAFHVGEGLRCGARETLEFDHVVPYALGGRSDHPANIRLLCRGHNQLLARQSFGEQACRPRRLPGSSSGLPSSAESPEA